jgi:hypothetical protein
MKIAILAFTALAAVASAVTVTVGPTIIARPAGCLRGVMSYCIPNSFKYQVCSPALKQVVCPIDSSCRNGTDTKGSSIAYCKYIG